MKKCKFCLVVMDESYFYDSGKYLTTKCKECYKKYYRQKVAKNKVRKYSKSGYKNIYYYPKQNVKYKYTKIINKERTELLFHTLQEALDFKYYFESFH